MGDTAHNSSHLMSIAGVSSKPEKDDVSSANRKEKASSSSGFTLEYPKRTAKAILENREYLENLFPKWGWQFQVFAGYDILPEEFRCAGQNVHLLKRFQGGREMLWVEMHETLLFRSPSFTRFVAKTIFDLLRNISETVFSPVGFLDVRDFWAWEYQADLPNEMEELSQRYFYFKEGLIPRFIPDELPRDYDPQRWKSHAHSTQSQMQMYQQAQLVQQQARPQIDQMQQMMQQMGPQQLELELEPRAGEAIYRPVTNQFQAAQVQYHYDHTENQVTRISQSGTSTTNYSPHLPVHGFADILYHELSHQISLSTTMTLASSTVYAQEPHTDDHLRSECRISVDEVDARISLMNRDMQQRDDPLRIIQTMIQVKPLIDIHIEETGKSYRSFTAHMQSPTLREVLISGISTSREWGASLSLAYPGAMLSISARQKTIISRPASSVGLDFDNMDIGIEKQNHFYWRYPIATAGPVWNLLDKSVQFSNHKGHITYPTTKSPDAISVQTSLTCVLLHQTRSFNRWGNPLRGLLQCVTFIRDNNVEYPCRHVRFNLHTDISPDDGGLFVYPRNGENPAPMDLGQYRFTDDQGKFCLQIQRREESPLSIQEPHHHTGQLPITTGRLGVTADRPGEFKFTEHSVKRESHKVVATLELGVEKPPRKKQMRRKPN